MNPTTLVKGDEVIIICRDGFTRVGRFLFRNAPQMGRRNGECYFIVPAFAGIDGPDDQGRIVMSDEAVRKRVAVRHLHAHKGEK
jgi:hypothetical protein